MFSIFKKDPTKKLTKQHAQMLEQAMYAQRNGDMRKFATLTAEAEEIALQIQALKSEPNR